MAKAKTTKAVKTTPRKRKSKLPAEFETTTRFIGFSAPETFHKRFKLAALEKNISSSALLRQLCSDYLTKEKG